MDNYKLERLKGLEEDMNDDYKYWKDSEKELKDAIEWRGKMSLSYANSVIKYYNYKKEIEKENK